MDSNTRESLVDEIVKASTPEEILLVEMKFGAVARHQQ